jgi:hypothetical protein
MHWTRVKVAIAIAVVVTALSFLFNVNEWLGRVGIVVILALVAYELVIGSTYAEPKIEEKKPAGKTG